MTKQIQFALYNVYGLENKQFNDQLRAQIEEVFSHGWELNKWEFVERGLDEANRRVATILVCVTREVELPLDGTPASAKRGRPAKENA